MYNEKTERHECQKVKSKKIWFWTKSDCL